MLLVFVDLDESYVTALERKFVEVLGEFADISIITDMCYYNEYFGIPRDIDVLVINEQLYDKSLTNHNIGQIYILTENQAPKGPEEKINYIYKYTSVQDIFNQISSNETVKKFIGKAYENRGGLVFVYSPIGGVGTTTLSIGAACVLKKIGYRVLFVSMENMQSFSGLMKNQEMKMPLKFEEEIMKADDGIYEKLRPHIVSGFIDYLAPFEKPLSVLGLKEDNYIEIFKSIRASNDYDYIVVDTDSYLSKELLYAMKDGNRIIVVCDQHKNSIFKLEKMSKSISILDGDKIVILCNKYKEDVENELIKYTEKFYVADYLIKDEKMIDCDIDYIATSEDIMRIVRYLTVF